MDLVFERLNNVCEGIWGGLKDEVGGLEAACWTKEPRSRITASQLTVSCRVYPNMKDWFQKILPQASRRVSLTFAFIRRKWIRFGIGFLLVCLAFSFIRGPQTSQVRSDSGDQRECFLGIPMNYCPMPEPQRSKLLALAAKTPKIPGKWITYARYPLFASSEAELTCFDFYSSIARWADGDPLIARWGMEDMAEYLPCMLAGDGNPKYCPVVDTRIEPGSHNNDEVKAYCAEHGYVPAPAPATSPAK